MLQCVSPQKKSPRELGYRFPAEWERQSATWMSWPRPEGISFPERYHKIGSQLCEIVRQISLRQPVHINVPNENWRYIVHSQLKAARVDLKQLAFHFIRTNEAWCRDHGPAFLVHPKKPMAIVDWGFNAWGGKYPPWDDDDRVPTQIARVLKIRKVFHPDLVMEGGAVDFNGAGVVLTTTDCLLNKNRNPDKSQPQIEQYLLDFYGQGKVCWLTGGIEGDDTDGHIDDLARFVNPQTIVLGMESNRHDRNYPVLKRVRRQLEGLSDVDGNRFEIVELPMPRPVFIQGQRCPATYMNFLFVNDALLVPVFRDRKNDDRALRILKSILPKHEIVGIDCTELIWGLGAIHCLTQQMP